MGEYLPEDTSSVTPIEGGESSLSSPICPCSNRALVGSMRGEGIQSVALEPTGPLSTGSSPLLFRAVTRSASEILQPLPSPVPTPRQNGGQANNFRRDDTAAPPIVHETTQPVSDEAGVVALETEELTDDARQRHSRNPACVFLSDQNAALPSDPAIEDDLMNYEDGETELLLAVEERTVHDEDNRMTAEDYQAYLIMNLAHSRLPIRMETVMEEPDSISGADVSLTGDVLKPSTDVDSIPVPNNVCPPPCPTAAIQVTSTSSDTSSGTLDDTEAHRDQFREMLDERVARLQMSISHSSSSKQCTEGSQGQTTTHGRRRRHFGRRLLLCGGDSHLDDPVPQPVDTNPSSTSEHVCADSLREVAVRVLGARRTRSVQPDDQILSHSGGVLSTHASIVSAHSVRSGSCSESHAEVAPEKCILHHRPKGFERVWLMDGDCVWPIAKEWPSKITPPPGHASMSKWLLRDGGTEGGTQTSLRPTLTGVTHRGHVWSLALSANGQYLAAGTRRGTIHVWRLSPETGKLLQRHILFVGHTGGVMALQWSPVPDTDVLISLAFDKTVRLWSMSYDTTLAIVRCVQLPIGLSFAHPASDEKIVMCTLDGASQTLTLNPSPSTFWKVHTQRPSNIPMVSFEVESSIVIPDAVTSMSVSPDGTKVAYGTEFGRVMVLSLADGRQIMTTECRNRRGKHSRGQKVTGIDWGGKSNEFLIVTTRDDRIRVVPISDPSRSLKFKGASIRLKAFMDPTNRYVICAGHDGKVYIWSVWEAARLRRPFRRREQLLAKLGLKSIPADTGCYTLPQGYTKGEGLRLDLIQPLPDDIRKRPTALPLAAFDVPDGNSVTSLLVTTMADTPCIRIICGTATGSVYVYTSILSD